MTQHPTTGAGHFHAVKFYESPESLCRMVVEFIGEGLIAKHAALVIATPEHRERILTGLRASGFDVDGLQHAGNLLLLDASEMLATFMVNGMPDPDRFGGAATRAIEQVCHGRPDRTIRAYGEMVDVLWKAGHEAAAIRLEMLWNRLATSHAFSLLCGYSMGSFYKDAARAAIQHQHSHVIADGDSLPAVPSTPAN